MKKVLSPIATWQHDDAWTCLQNSMACVLMYHGHDPVTVLGAGWDFYFLPGDVRWQEYYYPCRWPSLAKSLAPHHPISSRWRHPADAKSGWEQLREAILRDVPAIVAVDNYYLPYRPAYQDVHAAHLVVVYGFDDERGEAYVLDGSPPGCQRPVGVEDLCRSRSSGNPEAGDRDLFAGTDIAQRWLEVELDGEFPAFGRQWVAAVLADNLERFRRSQPGPALSGMSGMGQFFADLDRRLAGDQGRRAMDELYVFGAAVQASTALHAEFLRQSGRRLEWPELSEAGRQVDRLTHHWTVLRALGAHGREQPAATAPRLRRRAAEVLSDYQRALAACDWILHQHRCCGDQEARCLT